MKRSTANIWIASVGAVLFFGGWSLRSSVPYDNWVVKPIGGAGIAIGLGLFAWFWYRLLKNKM